MIKEEENFLPKVESLFASLMRDADCLLVAMSKIVEGGKNLIILSVTLLGTVFLGQLVAPFPWNFIALAVLLAVGLGFMIYNGYKMHRFERLKTLLGLVQAELEGIAPLMKQEFVKQWQWDDLVARKPHLLRLHGLLK